MIGRPPKRPEDRLTEVIAIRVTKEEADRLHLRALREGFASINQLLRHMLSVTKK